MIPGVTIQMGGRDFVVPPLSLGQLRRLIPKLRQLTDISVTMGEEQIGTLCEIVATAMQRNYPETTTEMVEDMLDLGNAQNVLNIVLTGSGLKPKGESTAGMTEMGSPSSTVTSPPAADMPIL